MSNSNTLVDRSMCDSLVETAEAQKYFMFDLNNIDRIRRSGMSLHRRHWVKDRWRLSKDVTGTINWRREKQQIGKIRKLSSWRGKVYLSTVAAIARKHQNHQHPNGTLEENGCGKFNDISDIFQSTQRSGYTHVGLSVFWHMLLPPITPGSAFLRSIPKSLRGMRVHPMP